MHPSEPDPIFPAPRRPRKGPGKLTRKSRLVSPSRVVTQSVRDTLRTRKRSQSGAFVCGLARDLPG
jgi:hypothetical protein